MFGETPPLRSLGPVLRALVVVLAVAGCSNALAPQDRVRLDPPAEYRSWWDTTRECVGQPAADFGRIRWWMAYDGLKELKMKGLWVRRHDIYVRSDALATEIVVRHEMVHDLLQLGDHESGFFESCVGRK